MRSVAGVICGLSVLLSGAPTAVWADEPVVELFSASNLSGDWINHTTAAEIPGPLAWLNDGGPFASQPAKGSSPPGRLPLQPDTLFVAQVGVTPQIDSDSQSWFLLAPYAWAPAMDGTVGAGPLTVPLELSLSDLVDLIPDLNGVLMLHAEAGRGPVGVIFDVMYMRVEPSESFNFGRVSLDSKSTLAEALGMVRVLDLKDGVGDPSYAVVDLLAGTRYYNFENSVAINPTLPVPPLSATQSDHWFDLIVGARGSVELTEGLNAFARGDVGGFGMGRSSNLAWNVLAGVEYDFACCPGTSLVLGYRVLDIDYANGAPGAERFVFDTRMHGPFFAFAFRF